MRDLIEMAYECQSKPLIACYICKYYDDCILCDILDVLTGNAPPIIDYPTPTEIIYAEGEWTMKRIRSPTLENGLDK